MSTMEEAALSALAAGDTDALRLHLQRLSSAAAPPVSLATDGACDNTDQCGPTDANPATDVLVDKAVTIADSLLRAGLPHLEREAAAAAHATSDGVATAVGTLQLPELGLTLRAESIMGGEPVWPAAYALCSWLLTHGNACCAGARCIELGAGGGAPGLVAHACGAAYLLATEGDASLLPLLEANCTRNLTPVVVTPSSPSPAPPPSWSVAVLDWRDTDSIRAHASQPFDLILAADVLYSVGDVVPLVRAACALMGGDEHPSDRARFLVARSAWFEDLQPTLVACAEEAGLRLLSESTLPGRNDDGTRATVLEFGRASI